MIQETTFVDRFFGMFRNTADGEGRQVAERMRTQLETMATAAIVAEQAEQQAERMRHARALEVEESAAIANCRTHEKALAPMFAEEEKITAALDAARERRYAIQRARLNLKFEEDRSIERHRAFCETHPQPAIVAFVSKLREDVKANAVNRDSVSTRGIDGRMHLRWQNGDSIQRRAVAAFAAIAEANALRFKPIEGAELDARLAALWDALPEIETRPAKFSEAYA